MRIHSFLCFKCFWKLNLSVFLILFLKSFFKLAKIIGGSLWWGNYRVWLLFWACCYSNILSLWQYIIVVIWVCDNLLFFIHLTLFFWCSEGTNYYIIAHISLSRMRNVKYLILIIRIFKIVISFHSYLYLYIILKLLYFNYL